MKSRFYILFLLTALINVVGAKAQEVNRLSLSDIKMSRGSEATLTLSMDNAEEITAVEFLLSLPDGFSINTASVTLSSRKADHTVTARAMGNNTFKVMVFSQINSIIPGIKGELLSFTLKAQSSVTDETDYQLTFADAVMANRSGDNVLDETKSGIVQIASLPNLHVISLDCSDAVAGAEMSVKWKVRNDGKGNTEAIQWNDYIWLVPTVKYGTSGNGSKLLATAPNTTSLQPGEYYENTANVKIDERIYGKYDIIVTTDMPTLESINWGIVGGDVPYPYSPETAEYNFIFGSSSVSGKLTEANGTGYYKDNFFYKQIEISVPPLADLQVTSVTANVIPLGYASGHTITDEFLEAMIPTPLTAAGVAHNTVFYSGKKIRVTATIANMGGAAVTNASWKNALYLSSSADRNSASLTGLSMETLQDITIQPGETTNVSFTTYLPYETYGDIYFHVYADTEDEVYELANTQNNWGCSPAVNVLLTPWADFQPQNLKAPSVITIGSPFSISYDVKNITDAVPYKSSWKDKIYISTNNVLNSNAKEIGSFTQTGSFVGPTIPASQLPAGAFVIISAEEFHYIGDNYSPNRDITVRNISQGTYYIHVRVDAENNIFEYNGEDNNVVSFGPIQVVAPDVTAEILSVSDGILTTGQTVAFAWKLKNIGAGDIKNVTVRDAVYVGSNTNGSNLTKIGEVSNTVSITSGGEKTLRANIKIPNNKLLDGVKFVYVKTNVGNDIEESNTSNNLSACIQREFKYVSPDTSEPTTIEQIKGMNISVSELNTPTTVTPGQQIQLSYKIKNTGELTIDKDITQQIFVSDSKSFNISSATMCTINGIPVSVNSLEPNKTLSVTLNVTIPSNIKGGSKYLHVVLDRNNQLNEKNKSDNISVSSIFINGNLPDFTISNLMAPNVIMTAEPTVVSWTMKNNGSWDANQTTCKVFLSKDTVYDKNDTELASVRSKLLSKGESETLNATVNVKDDITGNYYLIIRANMDKDVEESDNDNNTITTAVLLKQSPLPDLIISDLAVEGAISPGNTILVNAKVQNIGDGHTRKDKWSDLFYLSTDFSLTNSAIQIGSKTHVGKLEKNETYTLTATLTIPVDAQGYYFLYAKTDGTNANIEKEEDNNVTRIRVHVEDEGNSPTNLAVKNISVHSKITAGAPVEISYTLENSGQFTAKGNMREVIYLSKDQRWDQNDQMIGVVSSMIDLPAGNEEVRHVTGRITNVVEGSYYLIIRTNSTHSIPETDYEDNTTIAKSVTFIEFANLSLGTTSTVNTSGYYKLPVSTGFAGKTIGLKLTHDSTVPAGLYVAYESSPSTANYEWASNIIQTTEQEVLIPNAQEGNYYILAQDNSSSNLNLIDFILDGDESLNGVTMNLSANEIHFGASSLSIREGGNNGWITTKIHGALLDSIMDFRLLSDDLVIPIESMTFYDQTVTNARFNLNDAKVGTYDIVSELPDGSLATMSDGFRVIPGVNVGLGVKLDAPNIVRVGNYAPLTIAYANGGNTDIVIRELLLEIEGGYLATTIEGLKEKKSELHIRIDDDVDKRDFITIPPGKQDVITLYMEQQVSTSHLNLYIIK